MRDILESQKKKFLSEGVPSYAVRIDRLNRCVSLLTEYEDKIVKAIKLDFRIRSSDEIKISEID